jgi:hypothetical protein
MAAAAAHLRANLFSLAAASRRTTSAALNVNGVARGGGLGSCKLCEQTGRRTMATATSTALKKMQQQQQNQQQDEIIGGGDGEEKTKKKASTGFYQQQAAQRQQKRKEAVPNSGYNSHMKTYNVVELMTEMTAKGKKDIEDIKPKQSTGIH